MDFFDALASLQKIAPGYDDALRNALDSEVEHEEKRIRGLGVRNAAYARAVESAHDRIKDWIETADSYLDYRGSIDPAVLLRFVSTHRHAVVIAVLIGNELNKQFPEKRANPQG
jgi:hypothetical protein